MYLVSSSCSVYGLSLLAASMTVSPPSFTVSVPIPVVCEDAGSMGLRTVGMTSGVFICMHAGRGSFHRTEASAQFVRTNNA